MSSEIENERSSILSKAVDFFKNLDGVLGVFLAGSIPENKTDEFSDIDLRVVVNDAQFENIIKDRKSIPKAFGELLFNQWDDSWESVCVSHFAPFNKLDINYYKLPDLFPSPWYTLPLQVYYDPENIISDLINKSFN